MSAWVSLLPHVFKAHNKNAMLLYNKLFAFTQNAMTYLNNDKNQSLSISILWLMMICTSDNLVAQGVYKWVDKDGKVHYGDKRNAPSTSKESDIKPSKLPTTSSIAPPIDLNPNRKLQVVEPPRIIQPPNFDHLPISPPSRIASTAPPSAPDFPRMAKPEKWPEYKTRMPVKSSENAHILSLGEPELQKCIVLAVNLYSMEFGAERNAAHDHFLASCPKVKIECNAFRKKPEMNTCEAKAAEDKGPISVFKMTN